MQATEMKIILTAVSNLRTSHKGSRAKSTKGTPVAKCYLFLFFSFSPSTRTLLTCLCVPTLVKRATPLKSKTCVRSRTQTQFRGKEGTFFLIFFSISSPFPFFHLFLFFKSFLPSVSLTRFVSRPVCVVPFAIVITQAEDLDWFLEISSQNQLQLSKSPALFC